jgi:nucleoside-diphosphate-sugar epimerase
VIPLFIEALLTGGTPTVHGDGKQSRDFTFVADAVQANVRASQAPADNCAGKVYNVACGGTHDLLELLGVLMDHVGVEVTPEHIESRAGDIRLSQADIAAIQADLGFAPTVTFEDGLGKTLDWFRSRTGS